MSKLPKAVDLIVEMPDGSEWAVPACLVAENRAKYYAEKEGATDGGYDAVFAAELEHTLTDDYDLEDWAANNMNWDDVSAHARCVSAPPDVDFQEGWINGEKRVVRESTQ